MADDEKTAEAKAAEAKAAEEAAAKAKADEEAAAAKAKDDDHGKDGQLFNAERAQELIDKLRKDLREAQKGSKDAAVLQKRLDDIDAASLSEQQKLEKRAADAEAKIADAEQRVRAANLLVELAKPEHGIVSAQAAAKLLEGVEYGDDGKPSNLDAVLPDFLEANPYLKGTPAKPKPPNTGGTEGGNEPSPPPLTAEELEQAKAAGMSPERYAALKSPSTTIEDWDKIRAAEKAAQ